VIPDQFCQLLRPILRCPPVVLSKLGLAADRGLQHVEFPLEAACASIAFDKGVGELADDLAARKVSLVRVVRHGCNYASNAISAAANSAPSSPLGNRWPYTSIVMAIEACPMRCCTVLGGSSRPPSTLRLMHHDA